MAHEPAETPRGLWSVMRKGESSFAEDPVKEPQTAAENEAPHDAEPDARDAEASSPASRGKGLWAMMGVAPAVPPVETSPGEEQAAEAEEAMVPPAWFRGKPAAEPVPEPEPPKPDEPVESFEDVPPPEPKVTPRPVPRSGLEPFVVATVETPARARLSQLSVKTGRSRGAMQSFLVGLFAIPLTLLSMRPEIWTRIPPACVGFGALVMGLISFNEIQRSRGQQTGTGLAMLGMILGTVAMFLGPLVVAPWSESRNRNNTRSLTKSHLESIGVALEKYHGQYGQFPPGGTYRLEETGETTPMHSWMTQLLPYLGANETYHEIDHSAPWNEPLNKPPMGKKINAFLAGGVEQVSNQAGYGLSHFAGIGGQVQGASGDYVNVGIFERDSHVTRDQVLDGLSQTLIAGEIPEDYRPWGEPGNWRTLGDGLNRDSTSFGNAERTGAMFLKADGSVQFYSNGISSDVLKRLSTRDGDDNRLIPEKYR